MMWLLDHNLPIQLRETLKSLNVRSKTTRELGWDKLANGDLVAAAVRSGVTCILTRDVRFGETATAVLKQFPTMAIVLLRLPQRRHSIYTESFLKNWSVKPISPLAGRLIEWP